jgi:NADPH:quinone reductase-like Zn-dependent oxidoreductase
MSRAVIYEKFGGPEVLELRNVPEPHAGPSEIRIRVAAVGLDPMDPAFAAMPELAACFNITLPSGFGYDFAGSVDEVGEDVGEFTVGDRVYGGVMERAAADFVVIKTDASEAIFHTPEGLSDEVASTLYIAGAAASAALAAINLSSKDTVLVGGAAGGVGVFVVQLARLAGATVIGTASEGTFPFLSDLGAQPVAYGAAWRIASGRPLPKASQQRSISLAPRLLRPHWLSACHPTASPRSPPAQPLPAAHAQFWPPPPSPTQCLRSLRQSWRKR